MEEFEAHPVAPVSRTSGGEQAPADHRFAELQQAAQRNRMNGKRVNGDAGARVRPMLLAVNVLTGFVASTSVVVYALYGDAPFVQMARETGFFLLRQLSVVHDLIGGILSFSLF
jgi:hypothetical protein